MDIIIILVIFFILDIIVLIIFIFILDIILVVRYIVLFVGGWLLVFKFFIRRGCCSVNGY